MAPVDSSPPPSSVIAVPLSPVLLPHLSASPSPPFHTRPATPWPLASSNPPASSPPSSPSSAIDFPPLSAASNRRRSGRRSGSSSPSDAPSASAVPFPTPPFPPSTSVIQNLGTQIPSSLSPPLVGLDRLGRGRCCFGRAHFVVGTPVSRRFSSRRRDALPSVARFRWGWGCEPLKSPPLPCRSLFWLPCVPCWVAAWVGRLFASSGSAFFPVVFFKLAGRCFPKTCFCWFDCGASSEV